MKQQSGQAVSSTFYESDYDELTYGEGLAGLLRRSHDLLERPFGAEWHFPQVLEVGAGGGQHWQALRHGYDRYLMTDLSESRVEVLARRFREQEAVICERQDASALTLENDSIDRLITAHVLEHLIQPETALAEWERVLKPGGLMSILLPCDPGLLWRLGRSFGPRRRAQAKGVPYDYLMAREHVNSVFNLRAILKHHFPDFTESWYPARLPSADLNLFYCCHIRV